MGSYCVNLSTSSEGVIYLLFFFADSVGQDQIAHTCSLILDPLCPISTLNKSDTLLKKISEVGQSGYVLANHSKESS